MTIPKNPSAGVCVAVLGSLLLGLMATPMLHAEQSLESQANDPTASLMSFQLQGFYTPEYRGLGEADGSRLQFRGAIPFSTGELNHIARLTIPYVVDSPSGKSGLADATLFDLVAFDRSWGRFGVGAVALLPTGSDGLSAEKWGLGPALGFVAQTGWGLMGLFNQNIFTIAGDDDFADVNVSILQPILNVELGNGWSFGTSEMNLTYNWDANDFSTLPLGAKLSKMTKPGGVPLQWQFSYEHDFKDAIGSPKDTFGLTAKVLIPK